MASAHAKLRKNINGKRLISIVQNHVYDAETYPLTSTQINAALMLLKRALPELRSIEHTGKVDSKVEITLSVEE